jgi:hypothetical protein
MKVCTVLEQTELSWCCGFQNFTVPLKPFNITATRQNPPTSAKKEKYAGCLKKKSFAIVFQMLLCGECYENVYT